MHTLARADNNLVSLITCKSAESVANKEESTQEETRDKDVQLSESLHQREEQVRCENIESRTNTASDTRIPFCPSRLIFLRTRTLLLFFFKVDKYAPDKILKNF